MTTVTASLSSKPAPDYTGYSLSALIDEYYCLRNDLTEIDCDYNEHFSHAPSYTEEYKRIRKPYETKLDALIAALQPFYRAEIEKERQERAMVAGEVF